MTLLSTIQSVQDRIGLPRSTIVVSSTDANVRRLLAMANTEGKELARRHAWQALVKEQTFSSVATPAQTGAVPADFDRFVNETFYNRTRRRRVSGPLTQQQWQVIQATSASPLVDSFRVRGGSILLTPTPPAGDTYAYEYVSNLWVDTDADSAGDATAWAGDSNTALLSEDLIGLGIEWRFKASIGLDYAEAFRTYEYEVVQAIVRDGGRRTVSFANDADMVVGPGIGVQEGGWNL